MSSDRDQELVELWGRCARRDSERSPTEADWKQLYVLIHGVLSRCNAPELSRLPGERADHIDEYFNQKVFLAMRPGLRGPDHCGALVVFFRRYLRDLAEPSVSGSGTHGEPGEAPQLPEAVDAPEFRDVDQVLRDDCGKTAEEVSSSAVSFLSHLKIHEEWAWLMLRYGFCPDADQRTALVRLAELHRIPAHHYRAGKLGINHQWDAGLQVFRGTMLGLWLEEALGTPISSGKSESVRAALEILCFHALRQ